MADNLPDETQHRRRFTSGGPGNRFRRVRGGARRGTGARTDIDHPSSVRGSLVALAPGFAGVTTLRMALFEKRYHIGTMSTFLTVLLVLAMLGVLGVLGVGVATMIRGGNPRLSNKMMQLRVVMQGAALLILALLMLLAAGGR